MLRIKTKFIDNGGIVLLVLTIVFSFFYSMGYTLDGSQYDYFHYMHFVDEAKYADKTMVVGTLFFYKPLWAIFGNSMWLWNRFHWFLNLFVICIPYLFLLNNKQRKQFAYVQALAVLLFCVHRCGCEPPRLIMFFALAAVTLFVRYTRLHDIKSICFISLLLALIAFCRFPSLFVYPLFVTAVILTAKKKTDSVLIVVLPILFFSVLVSLTNGGIIAYIDDIKNSFTRTTNISPSHSLAAIFMKEVECIVELITFSFISIIPFLLLLWKKKNRLWWILSPITVLIVLNLIRTNPIPRWACAITIVLCLFYIIENKFSLESLTKSLLISFVPMIASVGSNCGFIYDFVSVAFLPYLAICMKSIKNKKEYYTLEDMHLPLNKGLLLPAFTLVVAALFCSNLIVRFKNIKNEFFENGTISVVNGIKLSPNLKYIYFSESSITPYIEAEKDYKLYKEKNKDVIFWGMDAHLMSFANDEWPITNIWKISSVNPYNVVVRELEEYAKTNRPVVIDMENSENTEKLLSSLGYKKLEKKYYTIYN